MKHFKEIDNALEAKFTFRDFSEAFAFMMRVALLAERHQHHPNWNNVYNQVHIRLNTHDAGNVVTEKDHKLAMAIENLV
jgi:4a-hydroxytetrahydrobiopterin dehydratase